MVYEEGLVTRDVETIVDNLCDPEDIETGVDGKQDDKTAVKGEEWAAKNIGGA